MKKLIAIAGTALLLVGLTGCAGFDTFQKAYDTCGTPAGITVSDGGKSLIIDGKGEEDYSGAEIYNTVCVLTEVKVPSYIISNMETTNSLMGRQSDEFDGIAVSWSYHPNNGLDIVINKKQLNKKPPAYLAGGFLLRTKLKAFLLPRRLGRLAHQHHRIRLDRGEQLLSQQVPS